MKLLAIARKDIAHQFRSAFALFMMLGAPLLVTGLMHLAFGGAGREKAPAAARMRVVVADLDRPDPRTGTALGRLFVEQLRSPELAGLLEVRTVAEEEAARLAVDRRQAGAAVIIPAGFSAAALGQGAAPGSPVEVELYRDPTLTLGPALLTSLLDSFLDGVTGARVAAVLAAHSAGASGEDHGGPSAGQALGQAAQEAAARYAAWSAQAETVRVAAPGARRANERELQEILRAVMASMLLFFVFFTGGGAAESLVIEREQGTLARLASTPTRAGTILAGKALATLLVLTAQVVVLLAASGMLFGISWGRPGPLAAATFPLVIGAAGFGLMLMSFVRSSRQAGLVLGVGLSLTGMLGGLFTNFIPGLPPLFDKVGLAVPQGWAARLWSLALSGAGLREMLPPAAVLTAIGAACFAVGAVLMGRRRA